MEENQEINTQEKLEQLVENDDNNKQTPIASSPSWPDEVETAQRLDQNCHHPHQHHQNTKLTQVQLDHLSTLIKIIRSGSFNEFTELIERGGFKGNLLNVFVDGQTALHYSLLYGRSLNWCKQLVTNGANPNLTNRAGWHPIHLAAFSGSRETMRFLIDCVSD